MLRLTFKSRAARRCPPVFTTFLRRKSSGGKRLSYYHQVGQEPLRQVTLGQLVERAALEWPQRPALIDLGPQGSTITYHQAKTMSDDLAEGLLELGLERGDRLAIMAPNTIQWYITLLAATKAGFLVVNINSVFLQKELHYCLKKVGVKALIMEEAFKNNKYYEYITSIAPEIANSPSNVPVKCKELPDLTHLIVISNKTLPGTFKYNDVLKLSSHKSKQKLETLLDDIQPDDPCNIQFSSGTTGEPKAAVLTHFTIANNSYFFGWRLGYHEKHHTICIQVPFFHTFGTTLGILCGLNHGATLVLPSPSYSVAATVEALKKVRCSIIYGTPTMYVDLCSAIKEKVKTDPEIETAISNLEIIVSGGAVCTPALFQNIAETLKCSNVASAYGMTEYSPISMQNTRNDTYEQKVTTVGKVAEHTEIKVVDEKGRMVPMGTPGEVWFRGYATMLGYWNDEEFTKQAITPCGWLKSGDLFILHENGYGQVVGRIKDVIIRGGENIFPAEIENFLISHPDILESHVYGVRDKRMGEEVGVSIRLKPGSSLSEEQVKEYCQGKISHYKIPKYIWFVDDFPKTNSGKIKKFVLKEIAEKELSSREK